MKNKRKLIVFTLNDLINDFCRLLCANISLIMNKLNQFYKVLLKPIFTFVFVLMSSLNSNCKFTIIFVIFTFLQLLSLTFGKYSLLLYVTFGGNTFVKWRLFNPFLYGNQ